MELETYMNNLIRLFGDMGNDMTPLADDFIRNETAMKLRAKTFTFHRDNFIRRFNNKVRSWNTSYPVHLPHHRRRTNIEAILKAHLTKPTMATLAALWESTVSPTQIGGTLSRDYFVYKDALSKIKFADLPESWRQMDLSVYYQYLPHPSSTDNTRVAYVQNYRKFIRPNNPEPLYTVTSPSKFWALLNETHNLNLAEHEIRDLGAAWVNHFSASTLHIAKGEQAIIDVIFDGPSESCQSRGYGFRPEGHIHPAACFDTPDFTVLYITEDNTPSGRVTGRLIANASTKEAARPYGNVDRMTRVAEAAGYKLKPLALVGCRLKKIEDDNDSDRFIMPYVDAGIASGGGSLHAKSYDNDTCFILQNTRGDYCTHECGYGNKGVTEDSSSRYTCSDCGCRVDEDDCRTNDHGDTYCDDCYHERYVYAYNSTRNRNSQDDCNRDNCIEFNGEWYLNDGEVLACHGIHKCAECDELFEIDDMYSCEDGLRCSDHATPLSDEFYSDADYQYADPDLTVETSAGETILDDDAVEINGEIYHKEEEVTMTAEDFQELITKARKQAQLAVTTATVTTDALRLSGQLRSAA